MADTPYEPYDVNFCYTAPPTLESDRVKLVPFIPSIHAKQLFDQCQQFPEIFTWLPFGPFTTLAGLEIGFIEDTIRKDDKRLLFAIFDKTKASAEYSGGAFAGAIAYINSSPAAFATEIGCVMILPPFQRTHVASNAVGILLKYALDLPSEGGLGLRRVFWQANKFNKPSVWLADRMGFHHEAILRWDRALSKGKDEAWNGKVVREGDPLPHSVGRDTTILSLCWDDWEAGRKGHVETVMNRVNSLIWTVLIIL
ncbi:acyl-CoA N-acyltransferase [Coprinopsis marcescibilis]|uniref:Acyl-CoA N-acyltransferase n=1 Tax=Coprinopsis marcescibilis TaxID=230819 RepID=A0A5C3KZW5_COPMA|nr:acyl-CoA N-acyltransferase [Coprinopsis marcescibilis]